MSKGVEDGLRAVARREGFKEIPCPVCAKSAVRGSCANWGGAGVVWLHTSGSSLSEEGLRRLWTDHAMTPNPSRRSAGDASNGEHLARPPARRANGTPPARRRG